MNLDIVCQETHHNQLAIAQKTIREMNIKTYIKYGWRIISTLSPLKIICNYNCGGLETSVHVHTKAWVWSVIQESTKA